MGLGNNVLKFKLKEHCSKNWSNDGHCRAGEFELPCHASTELCVITEGSAEIEDAQGRKTLVKPGDAFIIPQGSRTVWRIEEYVKKYYLCVLDLED